MYIIYIMNLKINIWTLNFLFKYENWYFNYEIYYFNFLKKILGFEIWYLNMKIVISIVYKFIWISNFLSEYDSYNLN
jgi:hypothetical protein